VVDLGNDLEIRSGESDLGQGIYSTYVWQSAKIPKDNTYVTRTTPNKVICTI
jgi:hypothetical protein